ncbi:glutathione S-transferase family protein [Shimia thalassica]|nr:glutathione S-transferase family protein [Shimia thalassica]MDP2492374.1 glutathione S-transferase family protein [Shimia thalassica]
MKDPLRLHYAPDNASGIVRLALEELGLSFETVLVDRSQKAQQSAEFRAINPAAKIPALETQDGTMFETAAILLWLADRSGRLAPAATSPKRASFLSWLFYLSNTLHANLRMSFYPEKYAGPDPTHHQALLSGARANITDGLQILNTYAGEGQLWFNNPENLSILDLYMGPMLRWMALYPRDDTDWFTLEDWPHLHALAARIEMRPSALALCAAEGMAPHPFTAPTPPTPPEGVAL